MQLSFAWEFLGMHGPALVEIVAGVPEHVAAGFAVEIHWQNYHSDLGKQNEFKFYKM